MNERQHTIVPPLGSYVVKRCPLRVQLDLVEGGESHELAPDVQMRVDEGINFEKSIVAELHDVATPYWAFIDSSATLATQQDETVLAIAAEAPVIVGARLPDDVTGSRSGAPDILILDQGGYLPIDIKHHFTTKSSGNEMPSSSLADPTPNGMAPRKDSEQLKNKDDALQLAHYRRLLEAHGWAAPCALGGIIGAERVVVWYDLEEPMWATPAKSDGDKVKQRRSMEAYDFEFGLRYDKAVAALSGDTLLPPVRIGECNTCGWKERCDVQLCAGSGDPSLLPRIGYSEWSALRSVGITSRIEVASLSYQAALMAQAVKPKKWHADALTASPSTPVERLRPRARKQIQKLKQAGILTAADFLALIDRRMAQLDGPGFLPEAILSARAAVGPNAVYRRPAASEFPVPRADIEIDIDMENVQEGCYLWGAFVTDRTNTGLVEDGYQAFVTWDRLDSAVEYENFVGFWDWLNAIISAATAAGRSVKSYCWHAAAENTQLRRITKRSSALEAEVETFIASENWVDLEGVFKRGWLSGESTGLKAVAPLAGFAWDVSDPGGSMSMLHYITAANGSDEARTWLLDYNRGDVQATLAIRDWLDINGHSWPEIATD